MQIWQSCPASSLNPWFSAVPCWSDLVLQALQFLAGETKGKRKLELSDHHFRKTHRLLPVYFSPQSLFIRWHDGTPQRFFSICGIF